VTTIADENGFCLSFVWIAVGLRLPSAVLLGAVYKDSDLALSWKDIHFVSPLYISIYIYIPISPKTTVSISALIEAALLYVHWQEQSADGETEYYMERIMQIFLSEEHRVADTQAVNAMGPRLQKLRQAADRRGVTTSLIAAAPQLQRNKHRRKSNIELSTTVL
jgi:hypothetical protein